MRLSPVVADPNAMVEAVAGAAGVATRIKAELDVDVYRVGHDGPGPDWVVRAFDDTVGRGPVETAAQVLAALAETPFPAERPALPTPVLDFREGAGARHLLVTEYVDPQPAPRPGFVLAWCAGLLARLAATSSATTSGATTPAATFAATLPLGGGWHRLGQTPGSEIDTALRLGSDVGGSVGPLLDLIADADDGAGLPEGVIHPDLTPPNAIPQGDQPPVIIDWLGVGRGPRIWALAFLLFAAGPRAAHVVLERYRRSVALTDEEWERLPGVMLARPLTLDLWSVAYERLSVEQAVARSGQHRARVRETVAASLATR